MAPPDIGGQIIGALDEGRQGDFLCTENHIACSLSRAIQMSSHISEIFSYWGSLIRRNSSALGVHFNWRFVFPLILILIFISISANPHGQLPIAAIGLLLNGAVRGAGCR